MKSSKTTRTQNERGRKSNKRSEKSAKLDRKSSRGMIYENEELRLRTININAEVERGQSDIKRLRRENEQLRREIWTLRDECDRLNKRFKAKLCDHEYGGCRGSGGSGGCNAHRCSGGGRGSGGCDVNSDDSDSCDTCRGDDGHCSDECCQEGGSCTPIKAPLSDNNSSSNGGAQCNEAPKKDSQPQQYDHLSVVSEETLSNPELLAQQNDHLLISNTPDLNSSQSTLPSLVGPLTPLTPIELVANQLNDLQAMVPPLSYFENILQQHIAACLAAVTPTPELGTSSSTSTGKTMRHTNGWDYNLESPFSHRKYNASPTRSPPPQSPHLAPPTLTTFVSTPPVHTMPRIALNAPPPAAGVGGAEPAIETVAITTNATQQALNSPKHFFAPIKPRLKLNTKLANQGGDGDSLPPGSPPPPLETPPQIREPPDIFVNNALASPYQRQPLRLSPQVSPRHRARAHSQCTPPAPSPCQLHQRQCQQQSPQGQHCAFHRSVVNVAATVGLGVSGAGALVGAGSVVDIYTAALATAAVASAASLSASLPTLLPQSQSTEPIYATAQKHCHSTCISATALTKPVMTVTTNSTKTTSSPLRQLVKPTACANSSKPIAIAAVIDCSADATANRTVDHGSQTDSVNLESILNDIETISEDILAIQLEKSKSRDNLLPTQNQEGREKTKKPYRSEMNLYLHCDGTNTTISPATTASPTATTDKLSRRTRSLERDREPTDSPAPHMPDPMAPFPDKCTYLGFDKINQAAKKPGGPLQRPQVKAPLPPTGPKPSLPAKPPPPLPPARTNIRMNGNGATPAEPPSPQPPATPSVHGLPPNKSQLYKALVSAAAKRAVFRSAPTQLTRSLDVDYPPAEPTGDGATDLEVGSINGDADAGNRKARRVSIVCSEEQQSQMGAVAVNGGGGVCLVSQAPTTTASCGDLASVAAAVLAHPDLKNCKQTSHSTPNSPHSMRRRAISNTMTTGHAEVAATNSAPPSTTHHHHRKDSGEAVPLTATVSRTKCSRRHSEGTVHSVHRNSNASGGGGGGGGGGGSHHHHPHHTHHHQHSSSLISNNPHHSHHSHQDSNHETFTSLSDRNSNSFASSRESSTSFSMRSNRRKISISSHTGGKIPWCGCWGNGCL
ncbi:proline-rich protein 36 isoform X2 [Scaptodrosophila lebanonensis]|uniref:Proline-rich protein 36 isoform X2 n=1 Tax=Drosophila lebanonensis TaxID=7225 RepID=A0A6J2TFX9_DROLE|nr:proline-rich protein 36 isoform X2 [Scaptodrosophila lebanonensis]